MTQVTLTLNFASVAELQAYLESSQSEAPKVAAAQPSAEVVSMPAAAPAAAPAPVEEPEEAPEVDLTTLRSDLMGKLRSLAEGMDDPAPVGAFINSFGVQRFSDLEDDQLVAFENQLKEQFGV